MDVKINHSNDINRSDYNSHNLDDDWVSSLFGLFFIFIVWFIISYCQNDNDSQSKIQNQDQNQNQFSAQYTNKKQIEIKQYVDNIHEKYKLRGNISEKRMTANVYIFRDERINIIKVNDKREIPFEARNDQTIIIYGGTVDIQLGDLVENEQVKQKLIIHDNSLVNVDIIYTSSNSTNFLSPQFKNDSKHTRGPPIKKIYLVDVDIINYKSSNLFGNSSLVTKIVDYEKGVTLPEFFLETNKNSKTNRNTIWNEYQKYLESQKSPEAYQKYIQSRYRTRYRGHK